MNESDADYLSQGLTAAGFSAVSDLDQADLAILVTCSVRQNAEQKAYGRFRELKAWKRARPGRAIAITGCMANKEKDRLYERLPDLDYRFDMRSTRPSSRTCKASTRRIQRRPAARSCSTGSPRTCR